MLAFGYGYYLKVSIHASVKDATRTESLREMTQKVSIHASVKDATLGLRRVPRLGLFQSTHL